MIDHTNPPWEWYIRKGENVDREKAFKLICDLVDELDKGNIRYWFNWGLLLGVVRDNDFIPWDTDLDITVHWEDRERIWTKVEPAMVKKGCWVPPREDCYPEDRWFIRDKEKIELNFVEDCGDRYIYSPNRCKLGCPKHHIDNLKKIQFMGRTFTIPSSTEEYLEKSYGKDWVIPQKGKKPVSL